MAKKVTLASARVAIEAERIGVPRNVAVVDAGANLVAFVRMDGAWLSSIDIAINKAFTARAFDMAPKDLARISQPEDPAFGIQETNHGRVVIFPGGIPMKDGGELIGAVVSKPDQDHKVAQAGADAFEAG